MTPTEELKVAALQASCTAYSGLSFRNNENRSELIIEFADELLEWLYKREM